MENNTTLITWNVRRGNKKIPQLISHAISHAPDIFCLQEVPPHMLPVLSSVKGYHLSYTYDFKTKHAKGSSYICILSKVKPKKVWSIQYADGGTPSLYGRLVYQKIFRRVELHQALVVEIEHKKKRVRYITARFSAAVGTKHHLEYLESILNALDNTATNILAGDFNIVDVHAINIVSGWTRGFKRADYRVHERRSFDAICHHRGFTNIFRGTATYLLRIPIFQQEHILIPHHTEAIKQFVSKKSFGSDHRMLFAQIAL